MPKQKTEQSDSANITAKGVTINTPTTRKWFDFGSAIEVNTETMPAKVIRKPGFVAQPKVPTEPTDWSGLQ